MSRRFLWCAQNRSRGRRLVLASLVLALVASSLTLVQAVRSARPAHADAAAAGPGLSRPDVVSAQIAARVSNQRVLVTGLSTETSSTWVNPDGTFTSDYGSLPTQAQDASGSWQPVDETLVAQADGSVSPKNAAVDVTFSGGGSSSAAQISDPSATRSGVTAAGLGWLASLPKPTVSGPTATYANVLSNTDLTATATSTGFELSLVVKAKPAKALPATVSLPLKSTGLAWSMNSAGVLIGTDSAGKVAVTSSNARAYDARRDVTGEPAFAQPLVMSLQGSVGAQKLQVTIPTALLSDPATVFPVTIDPATSWSTFAWTMVSASNPTTSYWNSSASIPRIGTWSGGQGVFRVFVNFLTNDLPGKHVVGASISIPEVYSGSCTARPFNLNYSSGINPSTTWNAQPTRSALVTTITSNAGGGTGCPSANVTGDVTGWAATAAADTLSNQHTLAFTTNEADTSYYKRFSASMTISVTYNSIPGTPTLGAITPCWAQCAEPVLTNSATPTIRGTATDAEGGTLRHDFEVYSGSTRVSSGSVSVGSGATATWTVPAGSLSDGGDYYVRERVYDGTDYGPWATAETFTVDTAAPAAPVMSSTGFVLNSWAPSGTSGTVVFDDADPGLYGYQWNLDGGGWSGWQLPDASGHLQTGSFNPGDGQHAFAIQTADQAGNVTSGQVVFGVGAGLSSPHEQAQTAEYVTLRAAAPSSSPYVTYQVRPGTLGTFSTLDPARVTIPGGSTHPTWPQAGTVTGSTASFANLTLDAHDALGADGILQIRGCFAADTTGTNLLCSTPTTVQVAQQTASSGTATIGPGSVNELSGNFTLHTTDVSVTSATDTLSIGRGLSTIIANQTASSPAAAVFGPGWTASLTGPSTGAADETLSDQSANGYVMLSDPTGNESFYTRTSASAVTFTGIDDAKDGSVLTANAASNPTQYTLLDTGGTSTVWTGSGATWAVQSVTQTGAASTTYSYDGTGRVTRILGPVPAGTDCTATPTACRVLTPVYATATAAQSDDPSGMTDYAGRLVAIDFTAANPAAGNAVTTIRLARYGYDSTGLLIGEWDPRLATPLLTRYAYSGGRLASLTPPGLKPFTFGYGSDGKLATVTRHDDALNADAVTRVVYSVAWDAPGSSSGLPDLSGAAAATWGQDRDFVARATAIFPADHPASATPAAADWPYADLHYVDADGRETNSASYGAGGWQIDSTQYDNSGNTVWSLTAGNRAQALTPSADTDPAAAAASTTAQRAFLLATINTYSTDGTELIDTLGPLHPATTDGGLFDVRSHTHNTYDQGAPSTGGPYELVTTSVASSQSADTDTEFSPITTTSGYAAIIAGDATGWSVYQPTRTSVTLYKGGVGTTLTHVTRYDSVGRVIETRLPGAGVDGNGNATDSRSTSTAYYMPTGTGACVSVVLNGLVCSTGPAVQPATGNPLPVTTSTYNMYGQPLVTTETAGTTVRATTVTYDPAGRPVTHATVVTPTAAGGTAIPTATTGYDATSGLPTTVSTSSPALTLTTGYDTQGRVVSYTDANGTVTSTGYDIDSRKISSNDGKATTNWTYDGTSGEHRGLVTGENVSSGFGTDSGVFSSTYDMAGQLATMTYPNGVVASSRFDNAGGQTSLQYAKSGVTWMTFTQAADGHGRTVGQTSPQSSQVFGYDDDGRLTSTRDTVVNGSTAACTTRVYALDADSNRIALASYPDDGSNTTSGHCSTSSTPVTVSSTFDAADRITNTGYAYDTLGRTTTVPGVDAAGVGWAAANTGPLTVGYYANDLVASEVQGGPVMSWALDPLQSRLAAQVYNGVTTINHYGGGSDSPSWISTSASAWTRELTGPNGMLAGTQTQAGAITLQFVNLHGDVVATDADSASSTGIDSYSESTEYGAPRSASSGYRPWGYLGGHERSTAQLGGTIAMGVRLYDPATARFLTTDPVPGGNDNPYLYVTNPIDETDIGGCYRSKDPGDLAWQLATRRLHLNKLRDRARSYIPEGRKLAEWGPLLWGDGKRPASQVAAAQALMTRSARGWLAIDGVSYDCLKAWRDLYSFVWRASVADHGATGSPVNLVAEARSTLLYHGVELLSSGTVRSF